MNCDTIKKLISVYIDNELNSELREQIATHLGNCPQCKNHYQSLSQLSNLFNTLAEHKVSEELHHRIKQSIITQKVLATQQSTEQFGFRWFKFAIGTIAVVCTILVGMIITSRPKQSLADIELLTPPINAIVKDNQTDICARIKTPDNNHKMRILLDDRDVTSYSETVDQYLLFKPIMPLSDGYHTITIKVIDKRNVTISQTSFSFLIYSNSVNKGRHNSGHP